MKSLIEMYLKDKENSWAETSKVTEHYRLKAVQDVLDGDAQKLWKYLEAKLKPYSRVTTWTRVSDFWQWALDEGHLQGGNPYRAFRKKNARLFKYAYVKKKPAMSHQEAFDAINRIPDPECRQMALDLFDSAMRVSEHAKLDEEGFVVGKGGKPREVYLGRTKGASVPYAKLRKALKAVGLKSHDLRKLHLSRAVELGANEFQLCEIAGWSSLNTASSYIKTDKGKLKALVNQVQGGTVRNEPPKSEKPAA